MDFKQKYGLTDVINAAGTFTPVGVSRSSQHVARQTAGALQDYFIIDELQQAASRVLASWSGAEAGAVTHCAAAAITLCVAAVMTGNDPNGVAALPDTAGLADRVILPRGHAVNYGQPITQAIRLSGAQAVLAGTQEQCRLHALEEALAAPGTACLLLVSSRLTLGAAIDMGAAVKAAHRAGVPAIIDGAAQDMQIETLMASGADLVLVSAQKYLASPTAGLVIGRQNLVSAVRAHEKGIGRGMKAGKEALCGVLAAIEERKSLDIAAWSAEQTRKVDGLKTRLSGLPGLTLSAVDDPAGIPLVRLRLQVNEQAAGMTAAGLSRRLKAGSPSVWVIDRNADQGELLLELAQLSDDELRMTGEIIEGLFAS